MDSDDGKDLLRRMRAFVKCGSSGIGSYDESCKRERERNDLSNLKRTHAGSIYFQDYSVSKSCSSRALTKSTQNLKNTRTQLSS